MKDNTTTPLDPTVDTGSVDISVGAPTNVEMAEMFADKEFLALLKEQGLTDEEIAVTVAELGEIVADDE